jgi:hypothetical protein
MIDRGVLEFGGYLAEALLDFGAEFEFLVDFDREFREGVELQGECNFS